MSSNLSQEEKLRLRREARRQKILVTGTDRLAQITGSYGSNLNNRTSTSSLNSTQDDTNETTTGSNTASPSKNQLKESPKNVQNTNNTTNLSTTDNNDLKSEKSSSNSTKESFTEAEKDHDFTSPSQVSNLSKPPSTKPSKPPINHPPTSIQTPTTQLRQRVFEKIPQSPSVVRTPQKVVDADLPDLPLDNPHQLAESFLQSAFNNDADQDPSFAQSSSQQQQLEKTNPLWKFLHILTLISIALLAVYAISISDSTSPTYSTNTGSPYYSDDEIEEYEDGNYKLLLAPYLHPYLLPVLRKLKVMAHRPTEFSFELSAFGFPVSIWMIFITLEILITSVRFYQKKSTSVSSMIPDDMKAMMAAAGLPTQQLNTWASILETANGYRVIFSALYQDVLLFVFLLGSLIMVADLLV